MRPALVVAAAGALVAQANAAVDTESGLIECTPKPSTPPSILPTGPGYVANSTTAITTTAISTIPDETATEGPGPTAGAISQPMKSSAFGLLGFLIVGLVML